MEPQSGAEFFDCLVFGEARRINGNLEKDVTRLTEIDRMEVGAIHHRTGSSSGLGASSKFRTFSVNAIRHLEAVSLSGGQDEKGVRGIFAPSAAAERGFSYFFLFFFFFSPRRDPESVRAKFARSGW